MDIPNARNHREVIKKGYLQKLSARSFPYIPHPWKRKYCILVKGSLFFYEREDSKGIDKGSGIVNFEFYDQVIEAEGKECKKATNVFAITSQEKGFFDQSRHLFSADSAYDMNDWIRQIKKTIEQTRNNRTTGAASRSQPASPRPDSAGQSKLSKEKAADKKKQEAKGKKRRGEEREGNKENEENFTDNAEKYQDSSLRRKQTNSLGDAELIVTSPGKNYIGRKKNLDTQTEDTPVTSNSLGRASKGKSSAKAEFNYAPGDLEGMMFGSLGRPLKSDKAKANGERNSSDSMGSSGSNLENRKRKADEDDDLMQCTGSENQLECATKHRVKGPSGRRKPQNRRTLAMKYRANSMSALAQNGSSGGTAEKEEDPNAVSFIPWLNRSLDLLEDGQAMHSNSQMGYLYSDAEDEAEELFEYNIGFNEETINYDEGYSGIICYRNNEEMFNMNSEAPPPLPPRMESRIQKLQQKQLKQQFQQQTMKGPGQNQVLSPFGSIIQKPNQRRSIAVDESGDVVMTQSLNNDLFIASFSDGENSGEQKILNKGQIKGKPINAKNSQLKQKRAVVCQPDINKFNIAVKNLQKHVVELDQAVNGITQEVEDSKSDLGNIKSGLTALKKEKERLSDSVTVITQEATKMKDLIASNLKESEKLQKTATATMVVAEKAKIDQLNLKKEYENMIIDLKNTIDRIKKEALEGLRVNANDSKSRMSSQFDEESDEDNCRENDRGRKGKQSRDSSKTRSSFFNRPSSLISGFTSLTKTSSGQEEQDKVERSPKNEKKLSKSKNKGSKKVIKNSGKLNTDDIPMMDESTGSPTAMSPMASDHELTDTEFASNNNFELEKSTSSPNVSNRPKILKLKAQKSDAQSGNSPDSPTRSQSPFDVPRFHLNGRATSPTRYMHRPGSTPGPLSRQGSMSTVPEDRAIDVRYSENRPTEPPPPPPTSHKGVFAISRQNSSPNIATQKASAALPRQHSLGVVFEEPKSSMSRQGSILSVPDDRLIVDRTLPMSPSSSMMSFPGSWSTTSLNKQDSVILEDRSAENMPKRQAVTKGPLELVAGRIISGSSLQSGPIAPYEEKNDEPPLATSSLKRKKAKKNPIMV